MSVSVQPESLPSLSLPYPRKGQSKAGPKKDCLCHSVSVWVRENGLSLIGGEGEGGFALPPLCVNSSRFGGNILETSGESAPVFPARSPVVGIRTNGEVGQSRVTSRRAAKIGRAILKVELSRKRAHSSELIPFDNDDEQRRIAFLIPLSHP